MVTALSFPLHLRTLTLHYANIPPFLNTQMSLSTQQPLSALSYSHSRSKSSEEKHNEGSSGLWLLQVI